MTHISISISTTIITTFNNKENTKASSKTLNVELDLPLMRSQNLNHNIRCISAWNIHINYFVHISENICAHDGGKFCLCWDCWTKIIYKRIMCATIFALGFIFCMTRNGTIFLFSLVLLSLEIFAQLRFWVFWLYFLSKSVQSALVLFPSKWYFGCVVVAYFGCFGIVSLVFLVSLWSWSK